jgi:hypothetical protein
MTIFLRFSEAPAPRCEGERTAAGSAPAKKSQICNRMMDELQAAKSSKWSTMGQKS